MADSKTILVVEDEQTLLKTIEFTLKDHGYTVVTAMDGEEALRQVKEKHPDLILLDILIPKKNGLEVLKELNSASETKGIPVLLLTNLSDEESISQGVVLGARGYFVKADMTLEEVADRVAETLEGK